MLKTYAITPSLPPTYYVRAPSGHPLCHPSTKYGAIFYSNWEKITRDQPSTTKNIIGKNFKLSCLFFQPLSTASFSLFNGLKMANVGFFHLLQNYSYFNLNYRVDVDETYLKYLSKHLSNCVRWKPLVYHCYVITVILLKSKRLCNRLSFNPIFMKFIVRGALLLRTSAIEFQCSTLKSSIEKAE